MKYLFLFFFTPYLIIIHVLFSYNLFVYFLSKPFSFFRLSYLHSKKIVHRDVKTENMLLDRHRTVKIADFGVARVEASNPNDMTGETGTLGYMAPEV